MGVEKEEGCTSDVDPKSVDTAISISPAVETETSSHHTSSSSFDGSVAMEGEGEGEGEGQHNVESGAAIVETPPKLAPFFNHQHQQQFNSPGMMD